MPMVVSIGNTPEMNQSGDLVVILNGREVILPISVIQPATEDE